MMERDQMLAHPNYRYISTVLDGFIIMVLLMPLMFLSRFIDSETLLFLVTKFLYTSVVYLIVDVVVPICTKGQTIGRYMFNLRVVKQDFTLASWKEFSIRASIFIIIGFLSQVLLLTTVSYIIWMIIFIISIYLIYTDKLRQTVHDKFAKTVVVFDKEFKEGTE
jgi:uncharacterized RDD family membrane protein YckC